MLDSQSIWQIPAAGLAGILLGAIYFGGLWWTIRRLPNARRPWSLYVTSVVVRMAAVLVTCWAVICWGNWLLLIACLWGWWIARFLLIRYVTST